MLTTIRTLLPDSLKRGYFSFYDAIDEHFHQANLILPTLVRPDGTLYNLFNEWVPNRLTVALEPKKDPGTRLPEEYQKIIDGSPSLLDIPAELQGLFLSLIHALQDYLADPKQILTGMKIFEDYLQQRTDPTQLPPAHLRNPRYLLASLGMFVPGPPPMDYRPLKKEKIIEAMLTHFELHYGVNHGADLENPVQTGTYVAAGLVQHFPKNFFKEFKFFKENALAGRMIFHGKNIHRIVFIMLCAYIERLCRMEPQFNRLFGISTTPSPSIIGRFLYKKLITKIGDDIEGGRANLWNFLIDNTFMMRHEFECTSKMPPQQRYDIERIRQYHELYLTGDYWQRYSYNSSSPFVFNSLLLCFSKELYPLLNGIFLDAFWKHMHQLAYRFGAHLNWILPKEQQIDCINSLETLYELTLAWLSFEPIDAGLISSFFPGAIITGNQTATIYQKGYIAPKESYEFEPPYSNWADYLDKKA